MIINESDTKKTVTLRRMIPRILNVLLHVR
jgi:hypothetical protein